MNKQLLLLVTIVTLIISCENRNIPVIQTTETQIVLDTPSYGKYSNLRLQVNTVRDLIGSMDTLEKGFQNLQIRIWYPDIGEMDRHVVVMKRKGVDWSGFLISYNSDHQSDSFYVNKKLIRKIKPKMDWNSFTDSLIAMGIEKVTDETEFVGFPDRTNLPGVQIEIAKPNWYRFYSCTSPRSFRRENAEVENLVQILEFVEDQLSLKKYDVVFN
jgi:hypothetical protein